MLWFRIGHLKEEERGYPVREVPIDMHDVEIFNRVIVTADHTLVIKRAEPGNTKHGGIDTQNRFP